MEEEYEAPIIYFNSTKNIFPLILTCFKMDELFVGLLLLNMFVISIIYSNNLGGIEWKKLKFSVRRNDDDTVTELYEGDNHYKNGGKNNFILFEIIV